MLRRTRLVAVAVAALAGAVVGTVPAGAATFGPSPSASGQGPTASSCGFAIQPVPGDRYASSTKSHLELGSQTPGVTLHDTAEVVNTCPTAATAYLYAADAVPAYPSGYGFKDRSQPMTQMGAWLRFAVPTLTLHGSSSATVAFTFDAPTTGLAGGEYAGALVVEPKTAQSTGGGVFTKTRAAMAVYVTLPAEPGAPSPTPHPGTPGGPAVPITHITVTHHGRQLCPVVSYANDSPNVVIPSATEKVTATIGGSHTVTVPRVGGGLLPGTTGKTALPCVDGPAVGPGHVAITLTTPTSRSTVTVDANRWPLSVLIALLFLLLLLAFLVYEIRRRQIARRREIEELRALAGSVPPGR